MIPPFGFFVRAADPFPLELDLLLAIVLFAVPVVFAPPDAVRLPAPPLFVAVEVFEPPERDAVADLAAPAFEPAFFDVPGDFDAPVLLAPLLFEAVLLLDPPVFDEADFLLPWLDFDDDPDLADVVLPVDFEVVFAVAIFGVSPDFIELNNERCGLNAASKIYGAGSPYVCILPYFA